MNNLELGKLGENIAKQYLENKGYKIIEQNCRNKYGEIDLICQVGTIRESSTLVFVEVKTRIGEQFGTPENALTRDKVYRLVRNAQAYTQKKKYLNYRNYSIDAVCIVLNEKNQTQRIDHYENITN